MRTLLPALLLLWSFAIGAEDAGPPSHCTALETVIFSCRTSATKVLSLCGPAVAIGNDVTFQYRFGPLGKPEFIYPATIVPASSVFQRGQLMYSGGGGVFVSFLSGPVRYVVFSRVLDQGREEDAGVVVERAEHDPIKISCSKPVASMLEPSWLQELGLSEDAAFFDVP